MTRDNTIYTYFMKIYLLKYQLIAIGETIDDGDIFLVALNGILVSWEPLIQGISAQNNQTSFDRLWSDCVQEEGRVLTRSDPQNEENQSLATHARKHKGRRFPYKKDKDIRPAPTQAQNMRDISNTKCYNCHQYGHFATKYPDQRKRKGKQHGLVVDVDGQPQKKEKYSRYDEMDDGIQKEYYFIYALSSSITNNNEIWLVYCGTSRHMTCY